MKDLISLIIPVYNVEKYLSKCLDSVVNQTYKNIEIIIINDGSTDSSLQICQEYKKKYSTIRLINQENNGIAAVRNIGLKEASGKYITFIDSDDYIDLDMIEKLYYFCKEKNADLVCCGTYYENENGKYYLKNCLSGEKEYDNYEALEAMLLSKGIDSSVWNKLYLKTLWDNISFPVGDIYEDLAVLYKLLYKSKKIVHIGMPKYHYIIRSGSITHRKFELRHLNVLNVWNNICEFCRKKSSSLYEMALSRYYLSLVNIDMQMKNGKEYKIYNKEYKEIKGKINKNIKNIRTNKYISLSKKIMCYMAYFNLEKMIIFVKKIREKMKQS